MDYKEASVEELEGAKKTTLTIVSVVGVLMLLYVAYVIYSISTGTWDSSKMLSIVPFFALMAITLPMISRIGSINKELDSRD